MFVNRSRRASVSSSTVSSPSDWQQLEDDDEEDAKPLYLKFRFRKVEQILSELTDAEVSDEDDIQVYVDVCMISILFDPRTGFKFC